MITKVLPTPKETPRPTTVFSNDLKKVDLDEQIIVQVFYPNGPNSTPKVAVSSLSMNYGGKQEFCFVDVTAPRSKSTCTREDSFNAASQAFIDRIAESVEKPPRDPKYIMEYYVVDNLVEAIDLYKTKVDKSC
jgi:hypothetical protein